MGTKQYDIIIGHRCSVDCFRHNYLGVGRFYGKEWNCLRHDKD